MQRSTKVDYGWLLGSDISHILVPMLGTKTVLLSFAPLNKGCLTIAKQHILVDKKDVVRAKPVEESGRLFSNIIDTARLIGFDLNVDGLEDPRTRAMLHQTRDLYALRRMGPKGMMELGRLNSSMYSYWTSTPSNPQFGIFHALTEWVETNSKNRALTKELKAWPVALEADCQYWQASRVHANDFIVLFERPDGTIVVQLATKKEPAKVYLVLGIAQSLGEVANVRFDKSINNFTRGIPYQSPKLHGPVLGVIVTATLVNWRENILYDGILAPTAMASSSEIQQALQAYSDAVDSGSIITAFTKKSSPGISMPSSGERQKIIADTELLKVRYTGELQKIRSCSLCHPQARSNPMFGHWVFRRWGYTEEENPNHMMVVLCGSSMVTPTPQKLRALEPTVDEYIVLLHQLCSRVGRPISIAVDAIGVYAMLKELLPVSCDIEVGYYPPPSPEESSLSDATNPSFARQNQCAVCSAKLCENGTPLMSCAQCKQIKYCGRAHQREHWTKHKKVCKTLAANQAQIDLAAILAAHGPGLL